MAEITYNDLLSQLSGMEKDQFEGVLGSSGFLGNYQKNPDFWPYLAIFGRK